MVKENKSQTKVMRLSSLFTLLCSLLAFVQHNVAVAHQHKNTSKSIEQCEGSDIRCAKTVTSAFAPNGDLWRLWAANSVMYFQRSADEGKTFSEVQKVGIAKEKISARNENRPKIAFDAKNGVYLSWAMPREKKYTADVRFSYSSDYGKTFRKPITVNNDNLLTGHSFNEMSVSPEGDISIVWLDGRLKHKLRQAGKKSNGSALFLAQANVTTGNAEFSNQQLANNTCVCCRIATDVNQQGELAVFWRHIYGDNIREFALLTVAENTEKQIKPIQISNDHWQINGCPHQGGGISIDKSNTYHMVWFNQGDKGKGIFYASSKNQGKQLTKPIAVGENAKQAAHPYILVNNQAVDIVWTQFNGKSHELWWQRSNNLGKSFNKAQIIATADSGADRPFIIEKADKSFVSWQRIKQGHLLHAL